MMNTTEHLRDDDIEADLKRLELNVEPFSRQRSRGYLKWLLVGLVGLSALIIVATIVPRSLDRGAAVEVETIQPQQSHQVSSMLSVVGYVTASEQVEINAAIAARAVAVNVREGDFVQRGQLLARLDDTDIRAQIDQARASLHNEQARLSLLEHGPRVQEVEQSRAALEEMEISVKENESKVQRLKKLAAGGLVSIQELSEAESRYGIALAQLKGAKQRYDMVRLGPRSEEIASVRAQVQQATANLALQTAQLEKTQIKAPIDGLLIRRNLEPGEIAGMESSNPSSLFTIINPANLTVDADVNQADFKSLRLGAPTRIAVDALPSRTYKGTVDAILPEADRQKNTVKVRIGLPGKDSDLRLGMSVKVSFFDQEPKEESKRAIFIPRDAVVEVAGSNFVFVAEAEHAVRRPIVIGEKFYDKVEVLEGLTTGEKLIVKGHNSLQDGARITIRQ